eukprot:m.333835 g.333835  ORF g.333835 m.333835 type:complete len:99 (+) comp17227_c0_seq1:45-341(+)
MAAPGQNPYRLQETQNQVDEVVGIMRDNIDKVLERDAKLSDMEDKSEHLADGAKRFQRSAVKLKNAMWWQDKKFCICLTFVIIIILVVIIVPIVLKND